MIRFWSLATRCGIWELQDDVPAFLSEETRRILGRDAFLEAVHPEDREALAHLLREPSSPAIDVRIPYDGGVRVARVEALPWADGSMDAVISSAVLHFARDVEHFRGMVDEMWRVLAPGGLFFARLATSISIEDRLDAAVGRVRLPDGSERFVVDEPTLLAFSRSLGGRLLDPLKTTNVQHQRAMTTWVLGK